MRKSLVILLPFLLLLTGCGRGNMDEESEDQEKVMLPKYRIVEVEEIHTPQAQRYAYQVVVDEQASKEQLAGIADEVISVAKEDTPFNALTVFFNDKDEYIGSGMTLGKAEHVPFGDWARANEVKTGDYDKMETVYNLYEKDWTKQLTDEEVTIYSEWNDEYHHRAQEEVAPDENKVIEAIAKKNGLNVEEVSRIVNKQVTWTFQGAMD